ncbi:cadherin-like and PC-esterase domain-containing protein 1, partial [Micropterus dolomieu]|uniref:cadherin-like and PC-esterase domain-containing protein 1 n=1 Tax=Micropterus dolomieu TaxID=147949 RepID=UPI001E8CD6D2
MRCVLASAAGLLLREAGMLLRRRSCSGPLLLLGVAVCLFYQLMVVRNRLRSGQQQPAADIRCRRPSDEVLMEETRRFLSTLETLQIQPSPRRRRAVVLMGRHLVSDTEVQLYQQVLQQMGYEVQLSRYAETSSFLRTNH